MATSQTLGTFASLGASMDFSGPSPRADGGAPVIDITKGQV